MHTSDIHVKTAASFSRTLDTSNIDLLLHSYLNCNRDALFTTDHQMDVVINVVVAVVVVESYADWLVHSLPSTNTRVH